MSPFARLRLLWSVLTGTVGTSGITHLSETTGSRWSPGYGAMVLAVDGEVMPGVRSVEFTVSRDALTGTTRRSANGPPRGPESPEPPRVGVSSSRTTLIRP